MTLIAVLFTALCGLAAGLAVYGGGHALVNWYFSYEKSYVERTEEDLYGMFSNLSPQRVLQWSLGCFAITFFLVLAVAGQFSSVAALLVSLVFSASIGLVASFIPRWVIARATLLRLEKFDLQLLDSLLSMSNGLKAGFSITQVFESIIEEGKNPIAQEFDLLMRELRLGVKFEVAAENLSKRVPSEDLRIVLAGIEVARQTGGNLTEVFDRLAIVIRERMRVQGRIQSLTAQGRMQGIVVGLMPFALALVLYFMQPAMMLGFIKSTAGILAIIVMLILQAMGFLTIRKIVTIDV